MHSSTSFTKIAYTHNGVLIKGQFETDYWLGSAAYTAYDANDWKVSLTHSTDRYPTQGNWKVKTTTSIRTPDLSGVRGWLNVRELL